MEPGLVLITSDHILKNRVLTSKDELASSVLTLRSFQDIDTLAPSSTKKIMLLDLDTTSIDIKLLNRIQKQHPEIIMLAVSSRSYHPELRAAIRDCFCACLRKPLDIDELIYWIDSLLERKTAITDQTVP